MSNILKDRKLDVVALQGFAGKIKFDYYTIYQSGGRTHELGTAFIVLGDTGKRVLDWRAIR